MSKENQQKRQKLLELVDGISVWERHGVRAPHKPLFLLMVLALYLDKPAGVVRFRDIERALGTLIEKYGPFRARVHPEYPFWRLQNDGLWEVAADGDLDRRAGHDDPRRSALRALDARGKFPSWVTEALNDDPHFVAEVATRVLDAHFPREIHQHVIRDTGLHCHVVPCAASTTSANSLWHAALEAYNYRCAISGIGLRLGDESFGAAPVLIRWPQAGGELALDNTVVLSSLHRDLFLLGVLTITPTLRVKIAGNLSMTPATEALLGASLGQALQVPDDSTMRPSEQNLIWHNSQVFRGSLVS